jgi:hypothetical protein
MTGIIGDIKSPISVTTNAAISDNGMLSYFTVFRIFGFPIYNKLRYIAGLDRLQSWGIGINFTLPATK